MRRLSLIVAVVVCAIAAAGEPAIASKRGEHPCRQGAAIARNGKALVFAQRWGLYGCLRSDMRVQHVFSGEPKQSLAGASYASPVVYGTLVAYGITGGWKCGSYSVVLYDLKLRKTVQQVPAGTANRESSANGCEDSGTGPVRSIDLWANGTMAFIAGRPGGYEVGVVDATGMRSIASGADIDPLSIGRTRDSVTWWQAGTQHTAPIHSDAFGRRLR